MAKEYAKKFYNSNAWRQCRQLYYVKKHGLCERCYDVGKIVHHKKHITPNNINDVNITLSHDNLELLCQNCHNVEHHERYGVIEFGLRFDENGDLVKSPHKVDKC